MTTHLTNVGYCFTKTNIYIIYMKDFNFIALDKEWLGQHTWVGSALDAIVCDRWVRATLLNDVTLFGLKRIRSWRRLFAYGFLPERCKNSFLYICVFFKRENWDSLDWKE